MKFLERFTDHPGDTANPQTYWEHGKFAAANSFKLIVACFAGLIHAVYPPAFPFYTSTRVIRAFKLLVESDRHIAELRAEFGESNVYLNYYGDDNPNKIIIAIEQRKR